MQVNVFFDRENSNKKINIGDNSSVKELLSSLGINSVTVIVARNNEIIVEDEKLGDNDEIRIYSVISGG